jgi:hypothetical protein
MTPRPDRPPAVLATVEGRLLRVKCPHCQREHFHGAGGGAGLRLAHCGRGGYRLFVRSGPPVESPRGAA